MSENKTGRYLRYAIGEIVLVMIGILLALQINTLNENRKLRAQEIAILQELEKNLSSNIKFIEDFISKEEGRKEK